MSNVTQTCIHLIISWHVQHCCLIKTIGSSDTSKTTKTSFSNFSRWRRCCLYSLWFNIQQSTTCTRKHTPNPLHIYTRTKSDFTSFFFNPQLNYEWYLKHNGSVFQSPFECAQFISLIKSSMHRKCIWELNVLLSNSNHLNCCT